MLGWLLDWFFRVDNPEPAREARSDAASRPGRYPTVPPAADTSPPARDIRRRVEGIAVRVTLEYCDQAGSISHRDVDIEALEYAYGSLRRLDGYCRKRRAERSFLVSGILSLTDLETGEVVEDLELWAADCAAHADKAT